MKKMLIVLSLLLASMPALNNVYAYEVDILPRSSQCTSCFNGTILTSYSYSNWIKVGFYSCSHHSRGEDEKMRRTKTTTYKCNYCGVASTSQSYEYKRGTCHGYD